MKPLKIKWRYIILPFLITTIIFCISYSLLHWLIVLEWGVSINRNVVEAYIPIILAFIITWKVMGPKLLVLNIKRTKSELYRLYEIVAALAMAAPVVFTQLYLVSATGGLSTLDNIEEIAKNKATKYYTLKNFYISKKNVGQYYKTYNPDLNTSTINCVLYLAAPIYASQQDEAKGAATYWLGVKYSTLLTGKLSNDEIRFQSGTFYNESLDSFMQFDLDNFTYLERFGRDGDTEEYLKAVNKSQSIKQGEPIVLYPRKETFENRNGNTFAWIFLSFGILFAFWLVMIGIPAIDYNVIDKWKTLRLKN